MKLLYFFLFLFGMLLTGYLLINDFSFDNISFSGYLINTLFIMIVGCAAVICVLYILGTRRRRPDKGMMTIRQYYQYKSAR
ncbi:hypothetical protein [Flavobacterium cyanobacteriorum]|nr:hypothetical protein [Flavobacterium cyanobacteriorum]